MVSGQEEQLPLCMHLLHAQKPEMSVHREASLLRCLIWLFGHR